MGYSLRRRQNSACYGRPYRTESCHTDCEIHREERERNRAEREARLSESIRQREVCEYKYARKTRAIRAAEDAKRR